MLRRTPLIVSILCAALLLGCYKSETTNNSNLSTGSAQKPSLPASSPAAGNSSSTAGVEKVGVPECDDFIAKYDACVSDKVPEMVRAQYKEILANWRKEWRKLAEDPATKSTLASYCKDAAEKARTSMSSFNCAW